MGVKKLSCASAEQTAAVTGMMMGGVTPFGLPEDLPLYIDGRLLARQRVVIGGGSRSCKIRLSPTVLERLPQAQVVEDLAKPPTPAGAKDRAPSSARGDGACGTGTAPAGGARYESSDSCLELEYTANV